jgi:phage gpG-like protein
MAEISIGINEIERLARHVRAAANTDLFELLDNIGQQQEDAARRRISETKRTPDGKRWEPWSERYAKTRKSQHSLLRDSGALLDSFTHQVQEDAVAVGSNMKYAGPLFMGTDDGKLAARPPLDFDGGFADSHDRAELRDIARDFLRGLL